MMIPRNVILPTFILDISEIVTPLNMITIPSSTVLEMLMMLNEFKYIT
jgi:hypothetical protein